MKARKEQGLRNLLDALHERKLPNREILKSPPLMQRERQIVILGESLGAHRAGK